MGHPAQYSGEKQGDSTDDVYGSKSEKKESARTSIATNKQTNNKQYLSKSRIQNLQLLLGHLAQYSGEKQGDSTDDVYGSKSEKKESARTSVEAMTLCAAAATQRFQMTKTRQKLHKKICEIVWVRFILATI